MNSWRMYAWSLVALMAMVIFLSGFTGCPGRPSVSLPPSELSVKPPAGADPAEMAAFYRKAAAELKSKAEVYETEAQKLKLEARQAWLWWSGVASILLGVVAFALAFAYPLASFLRIGGWAGVASGAAMLLIGEALPYIGLFALLTVIAIAASLILNTRVLAHLTQSWKSAANALPPVLRTGIDETSIVKQGKLVKPFIDKLLKKAK